MGLVPSLALVFMQQIVHSLCFELWIEHLFRFCHYVHHHRQQQYTAALKDECLDLLALSKKAELLFDDGVSHHILRVVQR